MHFFVVTVVYLHLRRFGIKCYINILFFSYFLYFDLLILKYYRAYHLCGRHNDSTKKRKENANINISHTEPSQAMVL